MPTESDHSGRWDRIEQLFHATLEQPESLRANFLDQACGSDPDLRRELDSLLRQHGAADSLFEKPAAVHAGVALSPPSLPSATWSPGTILGDRFRIVRAVGQGGMGLVYEAFDLKLNRRVALKAARPSHRQSLSPEARAALEVSHYNVCKIHDIHTLSSPAGEVDCTSMEFIEGETLADRLERTGPVTGAEALEIASQICAGLAHAHRQQVVHSDLKCGNVILTLSSDKRLRAVITDFGLARLLGEEDSGVLRGGTPDYMAPEQLLGQPATVASDIYALGVLFHRMLTGRSPGRSRPVPTPASSTNPAPDRSTTVTIDYVIADADWNRPLEPLPSPWRSVVTRCLAPKPENRPSSATAVAGALHPRRRVLKWAGAVALATALVIGGRELSNQTPVAPNTPVRLAVLPLVADGGDTTVFKSVEAEVADRLTGARPKFTVIPPRDAALYHVDTLDRAAKTLGATHVLATRVHVTGASVAATAQLVDLQSGRAIRRLQGTYAASNPAALSKALVATVTEAFRLPRVTHESLAPAAYRYYAEGIDLLRQNSRVNADRVIPIFNKAIELDPQSALPYAGLAEAQLQKFTRGDGPEWLDRADASASKARSLNADSEPVLLASGAVLQQHGQYEQAIGNFQRAAEIKPGDAEVWRLLATCYEQANRPDDAAATYERAIAAQPDYYRHYLSFGTFYLARGQYQRAAEQYRRVVAVAPALASGHMDLGLALMQMGQFPEAEKELLIARGLDPNRTVLINLGALYYAQGRFRDAVPLFEESLKKNGAPMALQYRDLGDAQRQLGRAREAAQWYRKAVALAEDEITRNPRRGSSHALLGFLSAFLGDSQRARFELSQALAMEPESRSVLRDSAIAYEALRERSKTLAVLRHSPPELLEELNRNPDVKKLQDDPEFRVILAKSRAQR